MPEIHVEEFLEPSETDQALYEATLQEWSTDETQVAPVQHTIDWEAYNQLLVYPVKLPSTTL